MDELDYLFIFMAYLVAGFIKGLTGIGFSTSCLPTMAMRLDLKLNPAGQTFAQQIKFDDCAGF